MARRPASLLDCRVDAEVRRAPLKTRFRRALNFRFPPPSRAP
ncbi:MAG: hypothetical protein FD139_2881 [Methylocystaceae bacterium]|nr:MAG: hypothetical protein FD172_2478 [Methylocystaceae bacterium]TXT43543.1 MAG: hypothetical protein FD139_2881 [Methylocystaceae bacterium]